MDFSFRFCPQGVLATRLAPCRLQVAIPGWELSECSEPASQMANMRAVRNHCNKYIEGHLPHDSRDPHSCSATTWPQLLHLLDRRVSRTGPWDPKEITIRWARSNAPARAVDVLSVLGIKECNTLAQLQHLAGRDEIEARVWWTADLQLRYLGPQPPSPSEDRGVMIQSTLLSSDRRTVLRSAPSFCLRVYDDRDVRRVRHELQDYLRKMFSLPADIPVEMICRKDGVSSCARFYHNMTSRDRFAVALSLRLYQNAPLCVSLVVDDDLDGNRPVLYRTLVTPPCTPARSRSPCLPVQRAGPPTSGSSKAPPMPTPVKDKRKSAILTKSPPPDGAVPAQSSAPVVETSAPEPGPSTSAQLSALLEERRQMRTDLSEMRLMLSKMLEMQEGINRVQAGFDAQLKTVVETVHGLSSPLRAEREEREIDAKRISTELHELRQVVQDGLKKSAEQGSSGPDDQSQDLNKQAHEPSPQCAPQSASAAVLIDAELKASQPTDAHLLCAQLPNAQVGDVQPFNVQLPHAQRHTAQGVEASSTTKPRGGVPGSASLESLEQAHRTLSDSVNRLAEVISRRQNVKLALDGQAGLFEQAGEAQADSASSAAVNASSPQGDSGVSGAAPVDPAAELSSSAVSKIAARADTPQQSHGAAGADGERRSEAGAEFTTVSPSPAESSFVQTEKSNVGAPPSQAQPDLDPKTDSNPEVNTTPVLASKPVLAPDAEELKPEGAQVTALAESGVLVESELERSDVPVAPSVSASVHSLLGSEQVPAQTPTPPIEQAPALGHDLGSSVGTIPSQVLLHGGSQDLDWTGAGLKPGASFDSYPSSVTLDMSGLSSTVQLDPVLGADDGHSVTESQPYPDSEAFFRSDGETDAEYELITRPPSMASSYD